MLAPRRVIIWCLLAVALLFGQPLFLQAQTEGVQLFFSPASGGNQVGSTFEVSILLDTHGQSVSAIDLEVKFPPDKLRIIRPSSDTSLLSIWLEPPTYSNVAGTMSFVGVVPSGITTGAGLVTTITFEAIASGMAALEIKPTSSVLANDGLGTQVLTGFGRANFTLTAKPLEGVKVYSDSHPFSDQWYNNDTVRFTLDQQSETMEFSYAFDNQPFTVPDNEVDSFESLVSFDNVKDGVWYFHVKAREQGTWGTPTHILARVDTQAPAKFKPVAEVLFAGQQAKAFISFFTTDAHSGIDHYEVGVLEADQSADASPVFVRAESPYQLPSLLGNHYRVTVRVVDKAGNVVDEDIGVTVGTTLLVFVQQHIYALLGLLLGVITLYVLAHLHFWSRMGRYRELVKRLNEEEHLAEELSHHHADIQSKKRQ